MESVRAAYDGFLGEFPLCYIYWKRYADHESNANSPQERVVEVYERAVAAFPNSVDLWTYYATYLMDKGFDPSVVRRCVPHSSHFSDLAAALRLRREKLYLFSLPPSLSIAAAHPSQIASPSCACDDDGPQVVNVPTQYTCTQEHVDSPQRHAPE